ncbi:MAG: hypothetical protein RR396_01090 [Clostridiales bacterium]
MTYNPQNNVLEYLYNQYSQKYHQKGFLKVQTYTARRNFPVADAQIEISKNFPQGKYTIGILKTDQAGATSEIVLPAADKSLSEHPGSANAYTTFDIIIKHPSFVEVRIHNIPVFEGILSLQEVDLIPIATAPDQQKYIEYNVKEPDNL